MSLYVYIYIRAHIRKGRRMYRNERPDTGLSLETMVHLRLTEPLGGVAGLVVYNCCLCLVATSLFARL